MMSSANTAQQAFYKNKQNKTGPTSAAKKKGGKFKKAQENNFVITDFDKGSCFLGVIKTKFSDWHAIVIDTRDDREIKCKARGFKLKFVGVGTPVVFSMNSHNDGEILGYFTTDRIQDLVNHFGSNYDKISKLCGISISINAEPDELDEVMIVSQAPVKSKKQRENDSDSNSDSLEPNPNHVQDEEDENDGSSEEISEEQLDKLKNISVDYSDVVKTKSSKRAQTNRINQGRKTKERLHGLGFKF